MNLHNLLYNNSTKVTPQRGSLLIADPMMEEVYFRRSVVMILDVDEIHNADAEELEEIARKYDW